MTLRFGKYSLLALLAASALSCAEEDDAGAIDPSASEQPTELALAPPVDKGYDDLPQRWVDANGDGHDDYCRFVGDRPNLFISCKLHGSSAEYAYNSSRGIDVGYSDRRRGFVDYNGDLYIDYCRYVGDAPNIEELCVRGGPNGFLPNQYYDPATDRAEGESAPPPSPPPPPSPQPSPEPAAYWYTVTCGCSFRTDTATKQLCFLRDTDPSWGAAGACDQLCRVAYERLGLWGPAESYVLGVSGRQGGCVQTFANSSF